jgi:hypothetical protein
MAKYKSEFDGTLVFPSLKLTVKKGDTFEADADLTNVWGIILVESKKPAKEDAVESTESSEA